MTGDGEQVITRLVDILAGKVRGARVADQVRAAELLLRTAGWLRPMPEGEASTPNEAYLTLITVIQRIQGRDPEGNPIDTRAEPPQLNASNPD
jgi:hypothetical protein